MNGDNWKKKVKKRIDRLRFINILSESLILMYVGNYPPDTIFVPFSMLKFSSENLRF